ncbi:MAG: DNA-binding protein Alba [Candidatus Bathyarchaeia archaeon]
MSRDVEASSGAPQENLVLVGAKPVMSYVVACMTLFNAGFKEISVRARGRAISRAVDTVELLRRAFLKDLKVGPISIGTETMDSPDGRKINVSTIDIRLIKEG